MGPPLEKPPCECPYKFDCYCNPGIPHCFTYNCEDKNGNQTCHFGRTFRYANEKQYNTVVRSVKHKRPVAVYTSAKFQTIKTDLVSHMFNSDGCFFEECAYCHVINKIECEGAASKIQRDRLQHYMTLPQTNARMDFLDACLNYPTRKNVSVFYFDNVFSRCQNKLCGHIIVLDHASVYYGDSSQGFLCCKKHFKDPNYYPSARRATPVVMEKALIYPFIGKFHLPSKKRHMLIDPCMFYLCKRCPRFIDVSTGLWRDVVVAGDNDDEKQIPPKCNVGHTTIVSDLRQIDKKKPCQRCNSIARAYADEPCGTFKHNSDGMVYSFYCKSIKEVKANGDIGLPIAIKNDDGCFSSDERERLYRYFPTYKCLRCEKDGKVAQVAYCYACLFWHNYDVHWTYWNVTSGSLDLKTK